MLAPDKPATPLTADEFEAFLARPENRDRRFELIHGEIVEKVPTTLHGSIAGRFVTALNNYLDQNPIGTAVVEGRFRPVGDTEDDRLPDVAFFSHPDQLVERGPAPGMPDLVVEVQSPDDNPREMLEKALFYLNHGSKLVFLILTPKRQVMRITPDDVTLLNEEDTLDGGEVLPGFTLPIRKLFPPK